MSVGILGEYIGRVFDEVKQRPLYVVGRQLARVFLRKLGKAKAENPPVAEAAALVRKGPIDRERSVLWFLVAGGSRRRALPGRPGAVALGHAPWQVLPAQGEGARRKTGVGNNLAAFAVAFWVSSPATTGRVSSPARLTRRPCPASWAWPSRASWPTSCCMPCYWGWPSGTPSPALGCTWCWSPRAHSC